jgi:hypothetical protein
MLGKNSTAQNWHKAAQKLPRPDAFCSHPKAHAFGRAAITRGVLYVGACMMSYRIREIRPVIGDWFCVSTDRDRWFIDRVIAWALVEAEGEVDHDKGIVTNGLPHLDEGDACYVASSDVGFLGVTWGEVYRRTMPNDAFAWEITDQVRAASTKR